MQTTLQLQEQELELPFYRKLGRTNLNVSCLGLGGGGGISSEDTLYAFDRGINFFFFSSDLHHYFYSKMSSALRELCGKKSSVREKVVLATVTYIKKPEMTVAALYDQFAELAIDYIDVFFWGWIGTKDNSSLSNCLEISPQLKSPDGYKQIIEKMFGVSERLKDAGIIRHIGASFHDQNVAQQWLDSPLLDVVMVRHNPAHRSAQTKVFNHLDPQNPQRPGVVTFKSAGSHSGPLWFPPPDLPKECWRPSVPDLYRYSLSQSCVDVCLTGLTQRSEIDAAIQGVEKGRLSGDEIDYLSLYGNLHRGTQNIKNVPPEKLIYRG